MSKKNIYNNFSNACCLTWQSSSWSTLISGSIAHCKLLSWTNNKGVSTVWRTSLNVHSESASMGQKRFRHLGRPVLCDRRNTGYVNQQLCLCGVIHSAVLIPEGQVFTNHTNTPYPLNCHKDLFGAMLHSVQSNELKSVNKCFFP